MAQIAEELSAPLAEDIQSEAIVASATGSLEKRRSAGARFKIQEFEIRQLFPLVLGKGHQAGHSPLL